jgi:hypothetical protein
VAADEERDRMARRERWARRAKAAVDIILCGFVVEFLREVEPVPTKDRPAKNCQHKTG